MPIVVGTDEAGYGPNLGPLVITATSWELPEGMTPEEMWEALDGVLTDAPIRGDRRLHVADSKKVYSAGKSITNLERAVLGFLNHLQIDCGNVESVGTRLSGERFADDMLAVRGHRVDEIPLPVSSPEDEIKTATDQIAESLDSTGIRLCSIQSSIMFAPEFNRRVMEVNSKGKVLSKETLRLVRSAVDVSGGGATQGWVICDKHGGRNRYDDVISTEFDDAFVFRLEESTPKSRYRVGDLEFCFRTKAEALLPVALASMVSKYMREIVMIEFNRFWQEHISELKPTKGYPVDAKRFWDDIESKASELDIQKADVWRCR